MKIIFSYVLFAVKYCSCNYHCKNLTAITEEFYADQKAIFLKKKHELEHLQNLIDSILKASSNALLMRNKSKIFHLIFISFLFSCTGGSSTIEKNNVQVSYYPSGKVKSKIAIDEFGRRNGLGEEFFENGKIKKRYENKNDTLNGRFTEFFESGKQKSNGAFYKGVAIGPIYYYSENGGLRLYNEYDVAQDVYYVKKYDSSGLLIKEEGVSISPNVLLNDKISDSVRVGEAVDVAFSYAQPNGYRSNPSFQLENKYTLNIDTTYHLAHVKTQFGTPGKYTIIAMVKLWNADSVLVHQDSVRKTVTAF
ncbi:MAG: hypothetical protein QM802_11545 [Agriterribacter sp.]